MNFPRRERSVADRHRQSVFYEQTSHLINYCLFSSATKAAGLLTIRITLSPRKNSFDTKRSLFTAVPLCLPFPPFDVSVHISFTSSRRL